MITTQWSISCTSLGHIDGHLFVPTLTSQTLKPGNVDLNLTGVIDLLDTRGIPWWWVSNTTKPSSMIFWWLYYAAWSVNMMCTMVSHLEWVGILHLQYNSINIKELDNENVVHFSVLNQSWILNLLEWRRFGLFQIGGNRLIFIKLMYFVYMSPILSNSKFLLPYLFIRVLMTVIWFVGQSKNVNNV